ncbi:MAG: hypothetical protein LBG80_04755 [Bacteroidales bacterium]|jgi:phage antirepressor YoqD-like protein|nr:hypothetical protein [Bacteroidales bacterium]
MNKIEIKRDGKIMMLKALKNGYFEPTELENLICYLYSDLSEENKTTQIRELSRKLGVGEPLIIEIIDKREQVQKKDVSLHPN